MRPVMTKDVTIASVTSSLFSTPIGWQNWSIVPYVQLNMNLICCLPCLFVKVLLKLATKLTDLHQFIKLLTATRSHVANIIRRRPQGKLAVLRVRQYTLHKIIKNCGFFGYLSFIGDAAVFSFCFSKDIIPFWTLKLCGRAYDIYVFTITCDSVELFCWYHCQGGFTAKFLNLRMAA